MRWDSRRWATEYVGEWAPVPECSNRPTLAGFAYNPKTAPFGGQSVIVLCPHNFYSWDAMYLSGNTVDRYHNLAPIATGKWHIDNLRGFLPAVLIHELTHAKSILAGKVLCKTSFISSPFSM